MSAPLLQCDCCDYFTIPEGCDYEICQVCFWEQDWQGVSDPSEPSCANHGLTLQEGRKNFLDIGCCAPQFKSNVVTASGREQYRHGARSLSPNE